MYTITLYDVINGEKTTHRILKPVQVSSLSEVNMYQSRLQTRIQRKHTDPVTVLVNYKVPIEKHVKWV